MKTKVSNDQMVEFLEGVPPLLRALEAERYELKEKVARYEKQEAARHLIMRAENKGHSIVSGDDLTEKVANLIESGRDFGVLEEAIKLAADSNHSPFGVGDNPDESGDSKASVEAAIMGEG